LKRIGASVIGEQNAEAIFGYGLFDEVFDRVDRAYLDGNRDLRPLEDISVSDPFALAGRTAMKLDGSDTSSAITL
jgi:hypothetical protein